MSDDDADLTSRDRDLYMELGRRLFVAWSSWRLGLKLATVDKTEKDAEVGDNWLLFAKIVDESMNYAIGAVLPKPKDDCGDETDGAA